LTLSVILIVMIGLIKANNHVNDKFLE